MAEPSEAGLRAAHEAAWGALPSWAQEGFGSYDEPSPRWESVIAAAVAGYLEFADGVTDG